MRVRAALLGLMWPWLLAGQVPSRPTDSLIVLAPRAVFDGDSLRTGYAVGVTGPRISWIRPLGEMPAGAAVVRLPGLTLLPGLIEGHSHLLLHPYDETPWNDQVLKESLALRVVRATNHARSTVLAGWTTVRDLGTEGADEADVGLRQAVDQGLILGPRILTTTRALIATGSYAPKGFDPRWRVPQGAEEADGAEGLVRTVRRQIGNGADWIKVYGDYRWGPNGEARPTYSLAELRLIVETAASSGRHVVVHASTPEGMRRATLAGARTIEHGDGGTPAVFRLMAERGVALCPTVSAGAAIQAYRGWRKGVDPEPDVIAGKRASLRAAIDAGVPICNGSDVGVFRHGDNVRELELLVEYGMSPVAVLKAATSGNADILDLGDRGRIKPGLLADLIAVAGDPLSNVSALRSVQFVMKHGAILRLDSR